jgi:molecular chaperone Hsp33
MPDQLQRFIFDDADVRGEIISLEQSYTHVLATHDYPEPVAELLGEFLAAAALLSATLKFDGILTLQARSEGEIPLIMAEATSDKHLRGIARGAEDATSTDFNTLLKDARLSITIEPRQGQRYQGVVPMDGANLAECIEHYFAQSEQLSTRLWFCSNNQRAAGLLLQELPASDIPREQREQQWQHISKLAETLTTDELLELDAETLLYRLYHQEQVRLFEPDSVEFCCSCSEERIGKALMSVGQLELNEIIAEQGEIALNCEFCNQKYQFNQQQVDKLFQPTIH